VFLLVKPIVTAGVGWVPRTADGFSHRGVV